ncbi:hypothetical protein D3C73_1203270 [compost metagenome]
MLDHAIHRFYFLIWCIFHQRRAKDDHHQHNGTPDNKGFLQPDGFQQMSVDKLEAEAAEAIRADSKSRNQPFTLREPFYAVGQR